MNEVGLQADRKGERTIKWLSEKLAVLQSRADSDPDDTVAAKLCKALKSEAFVHIKKLLQLSRIETVHMIEARFGGLLGHKEVLALEPLRRDLHE